ncbi:MAG: hypothetical protein HY321_02765 [Armatimonadetes bacterium]|nr:hypothetical protein [Armatimonadota bacterium]
MRRPHAWRRTARAVGLMLAAAIGMFGYLATRVPPAPAPVLAPPPQQTQRGLQQAQHTVAALRERKRIGSHTPFRLQVGSDEVNALLNTHSIPPDRLPPGVERVRDLRVSFEEGRIRGAGYVTILGREVHASISGRLAADGSRGVLFQPEEMRVGRLPMPPPLREKARRWLQGEIGARIAELGVSVSTVETFTGTVVIQGE